jgi:hypothetical protein
MHLFGHNVDYDAAGTEDRQGGHGPLTRRPSVLDVAQGMGLRAVEKVRSHAGQHPDIAVVCSTTPFGLPRRRLISAFRKA